LSELSDFSPVERRGRVMQVQRIRYFLVLFEELNFTRAAQRCGVSQPSLTGGIKRLEAELGGLLFTRKPRVSATPLGRAMAPLLKRLVGDVDDTLHAARSFRTDAGNRSEPQKPHIADAMRGSS
jgi:LysR family hydrogen peroxide-inducible transcriptional activator